MSVCATLNRGQSFDDCNPDLRKYIQRVVLINREDVDQKLITSDFAYNRVAFNLVDGARGYAFEVPDIASAINATFSKSEDRGIITYRHRVQFPITGVNEFKKVLLKQLDAGDVFAVLQFSDETVEVFGFNYGLRTTSYQYGAQNSFGGTIINMESRVPEYEPPLIYYPFLITETPDEATEKATINDHFDLLFESIPQFLCGDFNDDFNNDFFNSCDGSSIASI